MGLSALKAHMPKAGILWWALCLLLLLGLGSTILGISSAQKKEKLHAIHSGQHVAFDAASGETVDYGKAGMSTKAKPEKRKKAKTKTPQFDVATAVETAVSAPKVEAPRGDYKQPVRPPVIPASEEDAAAAGEALISRVPPKLGTKPERTSESLVAAPAVEISSTSKYGKIPKIAGNSFAGKLYARQFSLREGSVPLSIVVSGLGFSRDALTIALSLPNNISLAFSPYAPDIAEQIALARVSGHEVWAEIPSQNSDYPATDPGPLGQIASLSNSDSADRMKQWMARTHGVVGAIFEDDETLSEYGAAMKRVLNQLAEHGLMALFTEPARARFLPAMPRDLLAKVADWRIDGVNSRAAINSQLNGLLDATQREGNYVLVVDATPHMLKLVKQWTEQLPEISPVKLAPLSALYLDQKAKAAKQAAEAAAAAAEKEKAASEKESGDH